MARRVVWLVTGVVAGATSSLYAERKVRRTLEAAQARLQPDALVVEVGRTARNAASTTGERVREAVAAARRETRRREVELWSELEEAHDGRLPPGPPTAAADEGISAAPPEEARASLVHGSRRRLRRVTRNYPPHLAH